MILNEEIYGNIATVYHRSKTPPDKFKEILEKRQWKSGSGAGNLYGFGLYTVFTLSDNSSSYGSYLYKLHVKGIKNFYIFLPDVYNKVWGTNKTYEEIIEEQNKRFGINVKKYTDFIHDELKLHSKVAGIVFHGNHDGDVCLIFEPHNVIPISVSNDSRIEKTEKSEYSFRLIKKTKNQKINMSKDYKFNAFKNAGDIVNYFKKREDDLKKIEVGDFIHIYGTQFDKIKYNCCFAKKLKKNLGAPILKALAGNTKESDNENENKEIFDTKAFALYDDFKHLRDIVYFNGVSFNSATGLFNTVIANRLAKDLFGINVEKYENREADKNIKGIKENHGIVDFYIYGSRDLKNEINKLIPKSISSYIYIWDVAAKKNIYDITSNIVGEINFYFEPENLSREEKEKLSNKFGIEMDSDLLNYKIKNGKSGEFTETNKFTDYLKKELDKGNFFKKLNSLLTKKAKWSLDNDKHVDGINFNVNKSYVNNDKTASSKVRAKREKEERELEGKYIGKHQYNILNSVKTYFNY